MNVMSKLTVHVTAAAFATMITAASAWAFVSSSASVERDPFHFAEVMAANARVQQSGPALSLNFERDCWSESLGTDLQPGRTIVCRRGG
jgi:hypothetical protein